MTRRTLRLGLFAGNLLTTESAGKYRRSTQRIGAEKAGHPTTVGHAVKKADSSADSGAATESEVCILSRMDDLKGKVALVTGSSRGIGRAIALALAHAGAHVVVNFVRRAAEAQAVELEIRQMQRRCFSIQADVSSASDVERLVRESFVLGSVDILVNNAGISRSQPIEEIREQDWDDVISANLKSCILVTQAILPGDACSQVGTYREFVVGGGAGRRGPGTALRRLEGRNARAYSLLRAASGKGGDYGQRHRSGAGRDRDGDVESERATGEHSGGPIWIAGGSCAGRGHACPEWVHDWTDDQRQRRVVHELTD